MRPRDRALYAASGQVLIVGYPALEPPPELRERARRGALGGFILFRRNLGTPAEVAELTASLRALFGSEVAPWISIDQEGGRVARLGAPVVRLPAARVLGELDDLELTRDAGELLGRQLGWLGINLDFAPVLDVDTNPTNPVIGDRSFSSEVARVVEHGRALVEGLTRAGVMACGKHFPGHGDTLQDSHLSLPRLVHDLARLRAVELVPFAALAAELPGIMTAHVVFEALDSELPATLSARVVTGLLRTELGFRGLVFSDDLEMRAIADGYGADEAACRAIEAGCDVALICKEPAAVELAHAGLIRKAEREPEFRARLEAAATRSRAARRQQRESTACAPSEVGQLLRESSEPFEARLAQATMVYGRA